MPKCKSSRSGLLREWIAADKNFSTDGKVIFCQACEKQVRVILLYKFTHFLSLHVLNFGMQLKIVRGGTMVACLPLDPKFAQSIILLGNLLSAIHQSDIFTVTILIFVIFTGACRKTFSRSST